MKTQELKLWNLADLIGFQRYIRKHGICGTVRQNKFKTSAKNVLMLALTLPLDAATLEIIASEKGTVPVYEVRPYIATK